MKIAGSVAFLDDQGLYRLGLLQFHDPTIKPIFMDLLQTMKVYLAHDLSERKVSEVHTELVRLLTVLETKLPIYWCTFTRHGLLHLRVCFKFHGLFPGISELVFERHHRLLKSLTRATKNPMVTLKKHLYYKHLATIMAFDKNINPKPR